MGVNKLETVRKEIAPASSNDYNYADLTGKKFAVDSLTKLYEIIIAIRGNHNGNDLLTSDGRVVSHIIGVLTKVFRLIENNIDTCWVFDGDQPDIKKSAIEERRRIRLQAEEKLCQIDSLTAEERIKLRKKTVCITPEIIADTKRLLTLIGIPIVQSIGEAEAQCAALVIGNKVDGVLTEDTDALVFGANILYKLVPSPTNKAKKMIREIRLPDFLKTSNLTHDQFIEFCILLGTDYNPGVKGFGPITLYNEFLNHRSIKKFIEHVDNLNKKLKEDNKPVRIYIPEEIRNNSDIIIKYYKEAIVIDPDYISVNWNKPDFEGLRKFLCVEFELNDDRINKKIDRLKQLWERREAHQNKIHHGGCSISLSNYTMFQHLEINVSA